MFPDPPHIRKYTTIILPHDGTALTGGCATRIIEVDSPRAAAEMAFMTSPHPGETVLVTDGVSTYGFRRTERIVREIAAA